MLSKYFKSVFIVFMKIVPYNSLTVGQNPVLRKLIRILKGQSDVDLLSAIEYNPEESRFATLV